MGLLWQENVSTDSECNFDNKFTNWAHCTSVLCSCMYSTHSAKLHYDEFSSKSRSGGTSLTGSPRHFWATLSSFWFNVNNLQRKHPSGSKVVQKSRTLPIVIFFTNNNLKYPLTWQVRSLPSSTKCILLTVNVTLIVNTNIRYCLHLDIWDKFRFLGNCPPAPPLC